MANEFKHKSPGTELTQNEYEATDGHLFNSQGTGDILYASSDTQLTRLPIGSTGQYLGVSAGVPAYSTLGSASFAVGSATVFEGTAGTAWVDLTLGTTVGINNALALVKVGAIGTEHPFVAFRKNGDTDEFYTGGANGVACVEALAGENPWGAALVTTDGSGVIEWRAETISPSIQIDIMAHIK